MQGDPAGQHVEAGILKPKAVYDQVLHHQRLVVAFVGQFATELVRSAAFSHTLTDGCNADGSQKLRIMETDEIVNRAVEIAEKTYAAMAAKGWTAPVPAFADLVRADEGTGAGFRST